MGCQLRPADSDLVQRMVVQTEYDEFTSFSAYNSFTLSLDTLGLLSSRVADTLILDNYAHQVTARLKTNMDAAGFPFLSKNQDPDLGIAAFVVENYDVFQQINYYQPYYSGYYGYGYGGYYGYPYITTYTSSTTTMVINLIDLKNRDAQNRLKVIWTVYIGDLLKSVDYEQRILEAIDQAFRQSPYLNKP
jgi:hypothetical protein